MSGVTGSNPYRASGVVAIEGSMNPSVSSTGKALIMGF